VFVNKEANFIFVLEESLITSFNLFFHNQIVDCNTHNVSPTRKVISKQKSAAKLLPVLWLILKELSVPIAHSALERVSPITNQRSWSRLLFHALCKLNQHFCTFQSNRQTYHNETTVCNYCTEA
jgi:hypothetical protein